jgi:hypothetical protein
LYFTEQPYGLVLGSETGLPAIDSSSATLTFQSARNSCAIPSLVRPLVQQSFFPSGKKTGNPSNSGLTAD